MVMEYYYLHLIGKLSAVDILHSLAFSIVMLLIALTCPVIFKSIAYKKHNVFIIERYDIKASPQELKRIIDIDLCEI